MPQEILEFEFSTPADASVAAAAIKPEMNRAFEKRSRAFMATNKNVVSLKIVAEDAHALRASSSSYGRLFGLLKKVFSQELK